jgi:hypothetical protein
VDVGVLVEVDVGALTVVVVELVELVLVEVDVGDVLVDVDVLVEVVDVEDIVDGGANGVALAVRHICPSPEGEKLRVGFHVPTPELEIGA